MGTGQFILGNVPQTVIFWAMCHVKDRLCGLVVFLATDPEVLGSIPGAYRFSEKQWVWNGVHSAS
jgi:hypothetical protein